VDEAFFSNIGKERQKQLFLDFQLKQTLKNSMMMDKIRRKKDYKKDLNFNAEEIDKTVAQEIWKREHLKEVGIYFRQKSSSIGWRDANLQKEAVEKVLSRQSVFSLNEDEQVEPEKANREEDQMVITGMKELRMKHLKMTEQAQKAVLPKRIGLKSTEKKLRKEHGTIPTLDHFKLIDFKFNSDDKAQYISSISSSKQEPEELIYYGNGFLDHEFAQVLANLQEEQKNHIISLTYGRSN